MGVVTSSGAAMRAWAPSRWAAASIVALLAALAIGVPTGIVHTSFYTRMTPVTWWDVPVWAVTSLIVGLTAATYVRQDGVGRPDGRLGGRTIGASVLSAFAVGCPVCNKLVVALLGVSGALSYWAPLQPLLGVLSVGLLAVGLIARLRGEASCRLAAAN